MSTMTLQGRAEALRGKSWHRWAIAITVALGALLEVLDTSIVNVALADMQSSLGATLSEIGWVVTSYAMANVVIIPLSAWLGDFFGKKRYFVFSMVAFVIASVMCGFASSLPMLVFSRLLQGIAGGGLLAKAQAILFETFPKEEQGKAQATFGIAVIVGPALGPTIGGYLTTNLNWRWIFFINLPVGILAVLMAMIFLKPDAKERQISSRVDWTGIGLLAAALGSLQWVLEEGNSEDWFSSRAVVTLSIVAIVSLVLFIWRELSIDYPAVDLHVLKYRSVAAGSLFSAVLGMGLYGALFAVPIFAQTLLGYTPLQTGTLLFPGAFVAGLLMPFIGRLVNKIDVRFLLTAGALIISGTMFVLASINPQSSRESLFWPLIFRGVGTVLMFLPLSIATLGPVARKDISAASGFYNLTRQLGGSMGIAALTTLLARREAFHHAILAEKISNYSPGVVDRIQQLTSYFMTLGVDMATAQARALAILSRQVSIQAAVMSFGDIFRLVGFAFLFSLGLIFIMGKPQRSRAPAEAH